MKGNTKQKSPGQKSGNGNHDYVQAIEEMHIPQPSKSSGNENGANEKTFDLLVDKVPYHIKASPFLFNDEQRFYIQINDGKEHLFTWDSSVKRLRAIDDESGVIPDAVEQAISQKLETMVRQKP